MTEGNLLYYGDNLDVLRRHVKDESVDLVYLDPPFNSNANYNLLFEEHGEKAAAQVQAFTDTWTWDSDARADYEEIVEAGGRAAEAMRAFYTMLGGSDMMAYLARMSLRLVELHRVLKPTGSLYLHCDPTASHYLKLLLDALFGPTNFINEIVWKRTTPKGLATNRLPRSHDVLLAFAKDAPRATWNAQYMPHNPERTASKYSLRDMDGRAYQLTSLLNPNPDRPNLHYEFHGVVRTWRWTRQRMEEADAAGLVIIPKGGGGVPRYKRYLDEQEGIPLDSVWTDIPAVNSQAAERLGYPTQKPLALMERIIESSSRPSDLVLDPFCGCGTTIDAAQALGRRWVGIDITHLSIGLIKHRLVDRYGPDIATTYRTIGEPTTVDDARVLAKEDPFQFQAWALGLVGARVAGSDRKGGDKGIDGRLYFHEGTSETRQIVFSVKAGHLVPNYVRDLRGVIEREAADIGVLISFEKPTAGMQAEAAEAGFYAPETAKPGFYKPGPLDPTKYPRLQLRTVGQLLDGNGIAYPRLGGSNVTHRRAPHIRPEAPEPLELFDRAAEDPEPYA